MRRRRRSRARRRRRPSCSTDETPANRIRTSRLEEAAGAKDSRRTRAVTRRSRRTPRARHGAPSHTQKKRVQPCSALRSTPRAVSGVTSRGKRRRALFRLTARKEVRHRKDPGRASWPEGAIMSEQENETRTCSDCGAEFAFGVEERRFFEERGLTPPKRCRACRRARKAERSFGGERRDVGAPPRRDEGFRGPSDYGSGGHASGGSGGGGRASRGYGGGGQGGGGEARRGRPDDRRRSRPSSSDRERETRAHDRRPRDASDARPAQSPPAEASAERPRRERPKYDITCQRCGAAAQVPFKPIEGRALFCKPCYEARKNEGANAASPVAEPPTTPEE